MSIGILNNDHPVPRYAGMNYAQTWSCYQTSQIGFIHLVHSCSPDWSLGGSSHVSAIWAQWYVMSLWFEKDFITCASYESYNLTHESYRINTWELYKHSLCPNTEVLYNSKEPPSLFPENSAKKKARLKDSLSISPDDYWNTSDLSVPEIITIPLKERLNLATSKEAR